MQQIMKATRTWEIILVFLLLIVVAGFSATTEGFLDFYNLSDSTFNYSEKALIALVMALVIIAGEIDISVAATVARFGAPHDTAADDLRIEFFYPADSRSEAALRSLAGT